MGRCFTAYAIKEMQIKAVVKYHYALVRMAKIQDIQCWLE
jgi:hypothetical protein